MVGARRGRAPRRAEVLVLSTPLRTPTVPIIPQPQDQRQYWFAKYIQYWKHKFDATKGGIKKILCIYARTRKTSGDLPDRLRALFRGLN
jgi:hypothetical protein